jgi:hypothetical protein
MYRAEISGRDVRCLRSAKTLNEHELYNLESFDARSKSTKINYFVINRRFPLKIDLNRLFQIKIQSDTTRKPINIGALPSLQACPLINAIRKSPSRYGLHDFKG